MVASVTVSEAVVMTCGLIIQGILKVGRSVVPVKIKGISWSLHDTRVLHRACREWN